VKSQKRSVASRKMERLRKIKQENFEEHLKNEKSKQSFMFQSKASRFITPKPIRVEDLNKKDFKELSKKAELVGVHQRNLLKSEKEKSENLLLMTSYATAIGKVVSFNSKAPRFANINDLIKKQSSTPGPGEYGPGKLRTEYDLKTAL
jgi:hypothetical protein